MTNNEFNGIVTFIVVTIVLGYIGMYPFVGDGLLFFMWLATLVLGIVVIALLCKTSREEYNGE